MDTEYRWYGRLITDPGRMEASKGNGCEEQESQGERWFEDRFVKLLPPMSREWMRGLDGKGESR